MWKILIIWTSNCVPLMWDRTVSSYLCLFKFWSIYTRLLISIQWTAQFSASWKCKTIVGDSNFYVNTDTDVDAKKFKSFLHQFDLIQHVNVPMHIADNTLDLVISRGDISGKYICTDPSVRSDHFAVLFTLSSPSPGLPKQTVTYRSWKSVDHDQLWKDIGDAFSEFTCSDVESAVHNL